VILYCATSNLEKVKEFRLALADFYEVEQLPGIRGIAPPEETESTFEGNAALKATYYAKFCDHPVFADDSGLEVDALGGAPGVYSARYAGPDASDEDNNGLLLERMQGVKERACRFVCAIALAEPGGVRTFRGTVEGFLTSGPHGDKGFGYDPLFYYPPFGCTFGEAERERKTTVSHRGQALLAMIGWMKDRT
jgi:XTP/dITP diphosphohydrolase